MSISIQISESQIKQAAQEGVDAFIRIFTEHYWEAIGGELTAESMQELTTEQLTLLGYVILRDEVMDGGFIQLIHNGYGPFFFGNPFAKVLKLMGMKQLSKMLYNIYPHYIATKDELIRECSDEEFMALFERFPEFEDFDDEFVENEEAFTEMMAQYVDEHITDFAEIVKDEI